MYELPITDVDPKSEKAEEMRREYTELARKATQDAVKTFRRWKQEGSIEKYAAEAAAKQK